MSDEQKKTILIVDDDEYLLEMYVLKFKEAGFVVETAQDGKSAIEVAREKQPAVILLDVVLPAMDGFEILRNIRTEKLVPHARIIMLTNLGQKNDTEKGKALGADGYIVKAHFTPSEVVEKVEAILKK
ncbi:MAG: response regulator [Candidatus Ryanbacteria bacterium CG10_big_fil_rev_8_21_14_0_10_43_42]|uniref:Response regulator n=1 Tax=Candidatus Ryanbacteria bacterium CG10_big_fil_rev_8_21_14_0_10_43_42 TaxID=1974864 RepID=A0A2M8KXQ2_9BACT|nr:MAG: response regulator [Candidatus Ryanbacteria bacterium CG10_big_fil_rev_8_21_14_0_10_43_42]